MSHLVQAQTSPVYTIPKGPPHTWTLASLRQHLQTAVMLELYTIPLYLFAKYSVCDPKKGTNEGDAVDTIQEIIVQEMAHLGLAGNLLVAMRGKPQVYGEAFTPKYPSEILYEGVLMTLAPAKKTQIQNFVEIEQPVHHKVDTTEENASTRTLGQYESIGQFYESLRQGLYELHKRLGDDMFDKTSERRQWKGGEKTKLTPILDLKTAEDKLELIIEQGEGVQQKPDPKSHFAEFTRLSELDLKVYPLASNPRTSQFKGREKCYPVMLAFDAAYSYLLWTLEAGWTYGGDNDKKWQAIRNTLHCLMIFVLRPLALFLVKQKLQSFNKNAGPPFNLHIFNPEKSPLAELQEIFQAAFDAYKNEPEIKEAYDAVFKKDDPKVPPKPDEWPKELVDLGDI